MEFCLKQNNTSSALFISNYEGRQQAKARLGKIIIILDKKG